MVRRGSYIYIPLSEFAPFFRRNEGKFSSELWFASNPPNGYGPSSFPSNCKSQLFPVAADCKKSTAWRRGGSRVRKISPKFSCIKFFQIRDVPTQIPGYPGHSLSKTTEKGHLHKVFGRDIPTFGSRMSQEYPAQKLYV